MQQIVLLVCLNPFLMMSGLVVVAQDDLMQDVNNYSYIYIYIYIYREDSGRFLYKGKKGK